MKPSNILLFTLLVLSLILPGCVPNDNEVDAPTLKLDEHELSVGNSGGEVTIQKRSTSTDKRLDFYSKTLNFNLTIDVKEKERSGNFTGGGVLTFKRRYHQEGSYKTFDKLFLEPAQLFLNQYKKKANDIKAYEEKMRSNLFKEIYSEQLGNEDKLVEMDFTTVKPKEFFARMYHLIDGGPGQSNKKAIESAIEMLTATKQISLMFFNAGVESAPRYVVTNEFEELLYSEGYRYVTDNGDYPLYYNDKVNFVI